MTVTEMKVTEKIEQDFSQADAQASSIFIDCLLPISFFRRRGSVFVEKHNVCLTVLAYD